MSQQIVVFSLGSEEYGLPITQVQEIIRYSRPRTIPSAPHSIRGVINLRGKIIPVCDLTLRLGLTSTRTTGSKIVIVETQRGSEAGRAGIVTAGLVVDEVEEVLTVRDEQLEPPPATNERYVSSVAKVGDRLLVLLDLAALFGETVDEIELLAA